MISDHRRARRAVRSVPLGSSLRAAAVLIAAAAYPVRADVLRVPDDHATINDALAAAAFGDEIHVSSAGSPYVEGVSLLDGISLRGGFSPDFLSNDPSAFETVIARPPGAGTVVGLGAGGAGNVFDGFTVTGGDSTFAGGGLFCTSGSAFTISNCRFVGNRATVTGAGVQIAAGSSVTVFRCTFEDNFAGARGGGITIAPGADGATVDLCTFRACSTGTSASPAGGGGIFSASGAMLSRNRILDCVSASAGGGIFVSNASIRAWGNLLTDNRAATHGGGIYVSGGDGEIRDSLVEGCTAGTGGGGNGGGVCFDGGSNRWVRGFVRGNVASGSGSSGRGGGLYLLQIGGGGITGTQIVANSAAFGGGVYIEGFTPPVWTFGEVAHCTIFANASSGAAAAGGIHVSGFSLAALVNNVIAFQVDGHGIACNVPSSPNVRYNDVISGSGNTDSEYGADCTDRTGVNGNIRQDPLFCGSSATPPDLALQSLSPCLGAGEGGADMGAHDASASCGTVSIEDSSWGKIKALYR